MTAPDPGWHGMAVAVHHEGCHGEATDADMARPVVVCLSTYGAGGPTRDAQACLELPPQVAGELGRALIAGSHVAHDVQQDLDAARN